MEKYQFAGKAFLNKWVLSAVLKRLRDSIQCRSSGNAFHRAGAAFENARSPATVLVFSFLSNPLSPERRILNPVILYIIREMKKYVSIMHVLQDT
jgi:hypothetical protein